MSGALYEFARLIQPGDAIEYHPASDGKSASVTAVRKGIRIASLVVDVAWSDGLVYDMRKMGRPGYKVWLPVSQLHCKKCRGDDHLA